MVRVPLVTVAVAVAGLLVVYVLPLESVVVIGTYTGVAVA